MPADHGLFVGAVYSAVPGIFGAVAAASFSVPVAEYTAATVFSLIGIATRHFYEASKAGKFNYKALFFDLPTAPMLGIIAYIFASWLNEHGYIEPSVIWGVVAFIGFLGPDWLRSIGTGLVDVILKRMGNGKAP